MIRLRRLLAAAGRVATLALRVFALNVRSIVAVAAFVEFSYGCWLAWQPLGFIVSGGIVFAALTYSHLKGRTTDA